MTTTPDRPALVLGELNGTYATSASRPVPTISKYGKTCVVKKIRHELYANALSGDEQTKEFQRHFNSTLSLLKHIKHKNVVEFLQAEPVEESGSVLPELKMEYTYIYAPINDCTTLMKYLIMRRSGHERRQPRFIDISSCILTDVACGLRHLHDQTIYHCNLSPNCVIIHYSAETKPKAQICDFEMAQIFQQLSPSDVLDFEYSVDFKECLCRYIPPEVREGPQKNRLWYQAFTDIYSFGALSVDVLCTGADPTTTTPIEKRKVNVPREFQLLVDQCLSPVPVKRPMAAEVLKRLELFQSGRGSKSTNSHKTKTADRSMEQWRDKHAELEREKKMLEQRVEEMSRALFEQKRWRGHAASLEDEQSSDSSIAGDYDKLFMDYMPRDDKGSQHEKYLQRKAMSDIFELAYRETKDAVFKKVRRAVDSTIFTRQTHHEEDTTMRQLAGAFGELYHLSGSHCHLEDDCQLISEKIKGESTSLFTGPVDLSEFLDKAIQLSRKMVTMQPPMIVDTTEETFDKDKHEQVFDLWQDPEKEDSIYYLWPTLYSSYKGSVSKKGGIGNHIPPPDQHQSDEERNKSTKP